MNWLVTGGCGFIGRSLINDLLADQGHAIRIIDNLSVGSRKELAEITPFSEVSSHLPSFPRPGEVELVVGDILDEELAVRAVLGADVIIHLAANTGVGPSVENPRLDCMLNVIGTLNYLEAARKTGPKRFVFASSGAPAGECEPPIHEELPPHPVSPYGASKLAGEGYCSAYYRTFGVETVSLRFSNVYGPLSSRKESVVAKFIKRGMRGQPLEIYGDGSQTRDFLYIDDLVQAVRYAATVKDIGGETFQIATARETTVDEIARKIQKLFAERKQPLSLVFRNPRRGDVNRNFSDTSKAAKLLNWRARTDLDMGLETTFHWFEQQGS